MICKHCGHNITMAGGMCFHTENGFSQTCKICGCRFPEQDEDQMVNNNENKVNQ